MNKIKSELIELGMRFSAPVFFDDGRNMFLCEKRPVRRFHLETLKNWNIPYVVTYGHLLTNSAIELDELLNAADSGEELEELDELEEIEEAEDADEVDEAEAADDPASEYGRLEEHPLYISYRANIAEMGIIIDSVRGDVVTDISQSIENLTDSVYALVESDSAFVAGFMLAGAVKRHDFAEAAVNSAIMTYLICQKMNVPPKRTKAYVTGALVHDLGMLRMPESLLNKTGELSAADCTRLRMHTVEGERITGSILHCSREVTDIVAQHHECWDGTGYPRGLKEGAISAGAAIVAVCDAFEAMVTEKSYRTSKLGYEAMKALIADNSRQFSPDVVKAFIQSMGVYPIGSLVLLNDSSIAKVVQGNESAPLRPEVRLVISSDGVRYENNSGPVQNLADMPNVFIVRALDAKKFSGKS